MCAVIVDEPRALPALEAAIVGGRFCGITDRDFPLVQAELGAETWEVRGDNSLDGASVHGVTS